jgi:TonB family protein
MAHVRAIALLFLAATASHAVAQPAPEPPEEPVNVEVFKEAKILRVPTRDYYPRAEKSAGREGWVELNMMIDRTGKPYEVTVTDSSGNPVLEQAALDTVDEVTFAPALDGKTPIDSSFTFRFKFFRNGAEGASRPFIAEYRKFVAAIEADDKPAADACLAQLKAQNFYEEAYWHYGRYFYFVRWGTPADQLAELKRVLAGSARPEHLPKDTFVTAMTAFFALQVNLQDYGGALSTWTQLQKLISKEQHAKLLSVVDQIKALRASDEPLFFPAVIDDRNRWRGKLFRNRFALDVTKGALSEIKLRCEKEYLFFKYEAGTRYTVTHPGDVCNIEIVGDPGTQFVLKQ